MITDAFLRYYPKHFLQTLHIMGASDFRSIRHPENKIISVLVYLILCTVTWGVVYPAFLELSAKYGKSVVPVVTETQLSTGYFRRSGNKIYYLIGSTSKRKNDAVAINIDGSGLRSILSEESNVSENLKKQSAPFSDILIRETMTDKPSWLHTAYYHLENLAEKAWSEGIIHWLCFASFGLALCSVYALIYCSSWRMINTLYVWFGEVFVTVMNNLYFTPMALPVRLAAKSWGGFFRLLDEPALVTANVAVSLIFIIFGITAIIIRSRRSGR